MKIVKEKNNTWTIRAKVKGFDGKYHDLKVRGYPRKQDAEKDYSIQLDRFLKRLNIKHREEESENAHLAVLESIANGVERHKYTLGSVAEEYLSSIKTKVKQSTYNNVKRNVESRIISYFGFELDLRLMDEEMVRIWKESIINLDCISVATKNRYIRLFKDILNRANLRDIIETKLRNQCYLQLEPVKEEMIEERKVNYWTPEEYLLFSATFPFFERDKIMFDTLYYCGVRIGELLGLQWKHFDAKNKCLCIRQQVNNKLGIGTWKITTPKTKNANRDIYLNDEFFQELEVLKSETYIDDEQFIFYSASKNEHTPYSRSSVERVFKRHIAIAGIKPIRIHDLRHSHASLMIEFGADPMFIMKRLGHASYEETITIYGHLFPNKAKNIVSKLDQISLKENQELTIR